MSLIRERIEESIETKKKILDNPDIILQIQEIADTMIQTVKDGGKILLCGNGGSAMDASHIAGELIGRFQKERKAISAIALNADIASMTAIANDYDFEYTYARMVQGLMNPGDILVGISTSGNSENIYQAIVAGKKTGGKTVAFLGKRGGKIKDIADCFIIVPSECTARIQECHIMIGHILCELVEEYFAE